MAMFKKRDRTLQPKYTTRRYGLFAFRRRSRLPQLPAYATGPARTGSPLAWTLVSGALALLALIILSPVWLPALRWVIPDRYIMAYVPPKIQMVIFQIDVNEQVPTPASAANRSAAIALLDTPAPGGDTGPTPAAGPTGTPTPDPNTYPTGGYIQPTALPVAPTPTFTPPPPEPLELTGCRPVQRCGPFTRRRAADRLHVSPADR